jgi:hypothetical protein
VIPKFIDVGDGIKFELNSPVLEEYLRRNMECAKAYGAHANVGSVIERLREQKRVPRWLWEKLQGIEDRTKNLGREMAAYRDELKLRDDERWSGRLDSNQRPSGSGPEALPN